MRSDKVRSSKAERGSSQGISISQNEEYHRKMLSSARNGTTKARW